MELAREKPRFGYRSLHVLLPREAQLEKLNSDVKRREYDLRMKNALLPELELDRILRYERHLQKRMEWILQELRRAQETRRR